MSSLSCTTSGAPTGQLLGYDALRRLIAWQNATTSPTATASYAYDGEGSRVWQQTTSGPGGALLLRVMPDLSWPRHECRRGPFK